MGWLQFSTKFYLHGYKLIENLQIAIWVKKTLIGNLQIESYITYISKSVSVETLYALSRTSDGIVQGSL